MRTPIAIVAALLAALLIVPALVQWNGYKQAIVALVRARTGQTLSIDGPLTLRLLPRPEMTAHAVRLSGPAGGPAWLEARAVGLRPALWPLLAGRLRLGAVVLDSPVIQAPAGSPPGGAVAAAPASTPPSAPLAAAARVPPDVSGGGALPDIPGGGALPDIPGGGAPPDIIVRHGQLTYHALRLEDVNLTLSALRHLSGHVRLRGVGMAVDGARAEAKGDHLTLTLDHQGGRLTLAGAMTRQDGFRGHVGGETDSLRALARALGWPAARLPEGGARLEGALFADGHGLVMDGAALTLNGDSGTLSLHGDFASAPVFDLSLAFPHLGLDGWRAALLAPGAEGKPHSAEGKAPGAAAPVSSSASAPAVPDSGRVAAPMPAPVAASGGFVRGVTVNLALRADSLSLMGGHLRQARIDASLADGELMVNQAGVELPGQGELDLFGFFSPAAGGVAFDGQVEGRAADLRGLMAWLALPVPAGLPADRLRQAAFTAKMTADAGGLTLKDGLLRLDGSRAALAATLSLRGRRPALGLSMAVDRLDLDAYRAAALPAPAAPVASAPPSSSQTAPPSSSQTAPPSSLQTAPPPSSAQTPPQTAAAPPPAAPLPAWLSGLDANLKLSADRLNVDGLPLAAVSLDAGWIDDVLTLHAGEAHDDSGAVVHLTGGVAGLAAGRPVLRAVHWDLHAARSGPLTARLGLPAGGLDGPMALTGSADGPVDGDVAVTSRNEIAGGVLNVRGTVSHPLAAPQARLDVEASHADVEEVIRLLGGDYRPRGLEGGFALSARLEGGRNRLAVKDLRVKLGPVLAAGQGAWALETPPHLSLDLTAGDIPLDAFLPAPAGRRARLSLREQISRGLLIPTHGGPRRRFPSIIDVDLPPPPKAAPRPGVAVAPLEGHWSSKPLPLAWLRRFSGAVTLKAGAVTWGQTRLEQADLALTLVRGALSLDHLTGQLWGGGLTVTGSLAADGALDLKGSLNRARMRNALLATAGLGMGDGVMDGAWMVTARGQSPAEMVAHLDGGAKVAVHDGVVRGFDLKAVSDQLQNLKSPLGLLAVLETGLSGGQTRFSALTGTARIENGILVSKDLDLEAEGGGATGRLSINLPDWVMDSHIAFRLSSNGAVPPLGLKVAGDLDQPRRFVDVNAIQQWLAARGIGRRGRLKKAEDSLSRMLSGQRKADGGKVKAKDVLKSLLGGQ
ncbi:putative assembly protein [mine drainage metagenome]|uniref:Putative assembly protein n=1 Tax=mine drainage metagenome TaxID=410659 RepID=A0A1J5SEA3_9ZZZZ